MVKNKVACVLSTAAMVVGPSILTSATFATSISSPEALHGCLTSTEATSCVLDSDIDMNNSLSSLTIGASKTLDLNGHTLNFDYDDPATPGIYTTDNNVLTVNATNGGVYNASGYGFSAETGGKVIINGGTFNTVDSVLSGNNTFDGWMNFEVNGGTLNPKIGQAIYMPGQGTLKVTGGTLNGGVSMRMGQAEISGGTLINNDTDNNDNTGDNFYSNYTYNNIWFDSALTIMGGTYDETEETTDGNKLSLVVSGDAVIESTHGNAFNIYEFGKYAQNVDVSIEGGKFVSSTGTDIKIHDMTSDTNINSEYRGTGNLVNLNLAVSRGLFTTAPDDTMIADGSETFKTADGIAVANPNELEKENLEYYDEDGDGIYTLEPIKIDYEGDWFEELYDGENAVFIEIYKELLADRKAGFVANEITNIDEYNLTKGGELMKVLNFDIVDRDGVRIEVRDNDLRVYVDLSKEDYDKLAQFDKVYLVYFNEDKIEAERIEGKLMSEEDFYWLEFTTTHLSEYGIVGGADAEVDGGGTAATAPETGAMTAHGASATVAAVATAVVIGLLTSAVSFTYLVRKR